MKPADISGLRKSEYLKDKINELSTNTKNKIKGLYRGINEYKRVYDLLADSHIVNRWKNYFTQLLNMNSVNDVTDGNTYS
jgi:hypothetical protein